VSGLARSRSVRIACAIAVLALWVGGSLHDVTARLPYPTRDDQIDNLEQAKTFTDRFVFYWRGPLYVAWLGGHLWLSGGDPPTAMYAEKITSVLLLAALMAWLGHRLGGWRAGLLMGAWTVNCAVVERETTNNHMLAASLFTLSLVLLTSPAARRRLPWALLALLLATQVRQEMWLVLGGALLLVAVSPGRVWAGATWRAWAAPALVAGIVFGTIALRAGPPFPERTSFAFGQTFAKNYVERHGLEARYPDAWTSFYEILGEHVPALTPYARMSPLSALTNYPGELRDHLLQNVRFALRYVPALFLILEHPLLMLAFALAMGLLLAERRERRLTLACALPLAAIVTLALAGSGGLTNTRRPPALLVATVLAYTGYLGLAIVRDREGRWPGLRPEHRRLVLCWATLPLLILPLVIVFRVMFRHLLPLVPAGIFLAACLAAAVGLRVTTAIGGEPRPARTSPP